MPSCRARIDNLLATTAICGGVVAAMLLFEPAQVRAQSSFDLNGANWTLPQGPIGTTFFSGSTPVTNTSGNAASLTSSGGNLGHDVKISQTAGAITINQVGGNLTYRQASTFTGGFNLSAGGAAGLSTSTSLGTGLVTLDAGTGLRADNDYLSIANAITLNGGARGVDMVSNTRDFTLSGVIGGAGNLRKITSGSLTLSGSNAYTGGTTVADGTLFAGNANALGATTNALTVSGGTLNLGGFTAIQNGGLTLTGGTISTGTLTSLGAFDVQAGTISANLVGAGGVAKTGIGTVTLSGTNTYTGGTTVSAGSLLAGSARALGALGNTVAVSGGTLDLGGFTLTQNGGLTLTGGTISTGTLSSSDTFGVQAGAIAAVLSGSGALVKTGTGTVSLSGNNLFTGATTISGGTLSIQSDGALGQTGAGTTVLDGATLELGGTLGLRIGAEALTLNGLGDGGKGALKSDISAVYEGAITLGSRSRIVTQPGQELLTLSGGITGAGHDLEFQTGHTITLTADVTGIGALTRTGSGTDSIVMIENGVTVSAQSITNTAGGNIYLGAGSTLRANTLANSGMLIVLSNSGVPSLATLASTIDNLGTLIIAGGSGSAALNRVSLVGNMTGDGAIDLYNFSGLQSGSANQSVANTLRIRAGAAVAIDNNGNRLTLAGPITGAATTTANFIGGTGPATATVLLGNNTALSAFAGTANINSGRVEVNGTFGNPGTNTATLNVEAASTLLGNGTVAGHVAVAANGIFRPGDQGSAAATKAGTFTINGNLSLASGSTTVFDLTTSQQIGGTGATGNDLVKVGNLNVAAGARLSLGPAVSGYYRLFDVTGTGAGTATNFHGNIVTAGGATANIYAGPVDSTNPTLMPTQVNLLLSNAGQSVQFWDGADFAGGVAGAAGGAGTLSATSTNFAMDPGGVINDSWRSAVAVFGGNAGIVTSNGPVGFQGLQFITSGYGIQGPGTLNMRGNAVAGGNASASFVNVDLGSTTTIGAVITSNAGVGLDKLGGGTLILTGANTYSGLTDIQAGTVSLRSDLGLGIGTGGNADGTRVRDGAALEIQGGITVGNEKLFLNGAGIGGSGALRGIAGDNSLNGPITLETAARINSDAGLLTLAGPIDGANIGLAVGGAGNTAISGAIATQAGTLTKDGAGTLTLSGVNTYTGLTTVTGGTLINTGTIAGNVLNNATASNAGTVAGAVTNTGNFANSGFTGAFSNAGTATNAGTIAALTNTAGTFGNTGTVNGGASIGGGVFTTGGVVNGGLNNAATTNASGTVNGGVTNSGSFIVAGALNNGGGNVVNTALGTLSFSGAFAFGNIGTLTNNGAGANAVVVPAGASLTAATIRNLAGTLSNAGSVVAPEFTNAAGANLLNMGTLVATSVSTFNNAGTANNTGSLTAGRLVNSGMLTSTGVVNVTTNFANSGIFGGAGTLNSGTISNSGVFNAIGDLGGSTGTFSNMSGGRVDLLGGNLTGIGTFNNAGLLNVTSGTRTVGAAVFANQGTGVVNLAGNGSTTDQLTINGGYVGSAGSRIIGDIDLSRRDAASPRGDRVIVNGVASGRTDLSFNILNSGRVAFTAPIDVLTVAPGSSISVNQGQIERRGLLGYYLRESSPGSGTYQVVSQFNSAPISGVVSGVNGLISGLQAGFYQPSSAIVARPDVCAPNQLIGGPFIRATRGETTLESKSVGSSFGGDDFTGSAKSTSQFSGIQGGFDFGICNIDSTGWNINAGVMGGHVNTRGRSLASSPSPVAGGAPSATTVAADINVPFFGLYSFLSNGPFTLEVNVRKDLYDAKIAAFDPLSGASLVNKDTRLGGNGLSYNIQGQYRFDIDRWYVEPIFGLSRGTTKFGSLPLATSLFDGMTFRDSASMLGRAGVNVGTAVRVTDDFIVVPFAHASVWHEFEKTSRAQAISGGQTFDVQTDRVGTFGQLGVGAEFRLLSTALLGFVRADLRFGEKTDGKAVNAGVRLQF